MLSKEEKNEIIEKFAQKAGDTGSSEVQIALLSNRIKNLAAHLAIFRKDKHSRRGLLQMLGKRRSLLTYLKRCDLARFDKVSQYVRETK